MNVKLSFNLLGIIYSTLSYFVNKEIYIEWDVSDRHYDLVDEVIHQVSMPDFIYSHSLRTKHKGIYIAFSNFIHEPHKSKEIYS